MDLYEIKRELEGLGFECDRVPEAILLHYKGLADYGMGVIPHSIDEMTVFECYSFESYSGSTIATTYQTDLKEAACWGLIQCWQLESKLSSELADMTTGRDL